MWESKTGAEQYGDGPITICDADCIVGTHAAFVADGQTALSVEYV
jgi:hypothetical protein